jgi:hypothetical protein
VISCDNNLLHLQRVGTKRSDFERKKEISNKINCTGNSIIISGTVEFLPHRCKNDNTTLGLYETGVYTVGENDVLTVSSFPACFSYICVITSIPATVISHHVPIAVRSEAPFPRAAGIGAGDGRFPTGVPGYIRSAAVKVTALLTLPARRPAFTRG